MESIPELKKLYEEYHDKGLEIVGISLDRRRADLVKFIDENEIEWIQTYSGPDADPTAKKYGIRAIPSLWLIGRDGKVITDKARMGTEALVVEALKPQENPLVPEDSSKAAPTTMPD